MRSSPSRRRGGPGTRVASAGPGAWGGGRRHRVTCLWAHSLLPAGREGRGRALVRAHVSPASATAAPGTLCRFPFSRPELLKAWVLNIGRGDFEPKQHTVICSEHFRPECFSAFGNRKNLKHNAVPTVFAFQDAAQLVREDTEPAGEGGNADSEKEKVLSEAGARERGPGRQPDAALGALQLPPSAGGPVRQVPPHGREAAAAPGQPAGASQPSDHSYALLDLDALKRKLFLTLKENEKLRKRLKAQRLVMQRMCGRRRAHKAGPRGLQARARPEQQH